MDTLVTILRRAAAQWPDGEALRFDFTGETLSFGELDRLTDNLAAALRGACVEGGDRVVVCSSNRALFPIAWFATMKAGAIMVPLNTQYRIEDARHILKAATPKAAFADQERTAMLTELQCSVPTLRLLLTDAESVPDGWYAVDEFGQSAGGSFKIDAIDPSDLTNIQFTSGTSGMPKGCMLSHEYWLELARSVDEQVIALEPGDTMLTAQAFSYLDPQWALVLTLMKGARLVVLERFRPSELFDKIADYEAKFFYCLAAMPLMLLALPASAAERQHRLEAIMCSEIPADRHRELEARFNVPWVEAYGATETGSDLGVRWSDHERSVGTGTIGRPLPHRQAMIVDERFSTVPNGEIGELVVRGRAMMRGYWQDSEATNAAFKDGWYRTGDLAREDAGGLFFLEGRKKDMIRRAGENIAASEVEGVLQQHPAVVLAACVAVPDPIRNEEIKVFVIRSGNASPVELIEFLQSRLARFKIPRYWTFVPALPMTPSERVAKPQLSKAVDGDVYDAQPAHQVGAQS